MLQMNDDNLDSPGAIKAFLAGANNLSLSVPKEQRYPWIARTLQRTGYFRLHRNDKPIVFEYMRIVTGYSRAQLTRLVNQYRTKSCIKKKVGLRNKFSRHYVRADILLLAIVDEAHQVLNGHATKKLLERAYEVFKDEAYERLAKISVAHIYNLRKSTIYKSKIKHFTKTKHNSVAIGERRKPQSNGQPGYLRVDTVHQGDQDKQKGVYHINAVDEVTQFEIIVTVEKISERYLLPVLEAIIKAFPFFIINFHSDCGSEYINHRVVALLNKLHIKLTKSRARHCNDNALAESKNGSIVRKYFGYIHIPQKWAPLINEFNQQYLVPYLNFHRPCYFVKIIIDKKGKERKIYPYEDMSTPYERLKSLNNAESFLKPGITFEELNQQAMAMTDLAAAKLVLKERRKLFDVIFADPKM